MLLLLAGFIGVSVSIFGITFSNEVKNRKYIQKKNLKKMVPKFGFKFKKYCLSMATILSSSITIYFWEFLPSSYIVESVLLIALSSFLMLSQLFENIFGMKHISVGDVLSQKEVSKLVHLTEKRNSFIDNEFCPLQASNNFVRFTKVLKDGSKLMGIDDFVLYSIPSEKIESVLEMKSQLQELEVMIEANLLKGYFNDKNDSEECKKGIALVNTIHDTFYELRKDVAKQTFSKKAIKEIEKETKSKESLSDSTSIIANDLGLALLDMKAVSGDIQYSSEDRKRADEYVLRIEKELEKRNEKLQEEKMKQNVHVLFQTVEDVLEKNKI